MTNLMKVFEVETRKPSFSCSGFCTNFATINLHYNKWVRAFFRRKKNKKYNFTTKEIKREIELVRLLEQNKNTICERNASSFLEYGI